jgi:hypothetical protein
MDYLSEQWIEAIFDARQASDGGIVRRSIRTVQNGASEELLVKAVKSRGFHVVRTETQYVIFCNSGEIKLLV